MPTIGESFRTAREAKKVTTSQAAAATRIMIQHIEAMERDNFSVMAAAAYAKGFIRLYAEYLGLDPAPLVREYVELHAPRDRAPLIAEPGRPPERKREGPGTMAKLLAAVSPERLRQGLTGAGLALLIVLALWGLSRCDRGGGAAAATAGGADQGQLDILEPPPEPYIEEPR